MTQMALEIQRMNCGHCVARVRKALATLPGVQVERVEVGSARVKADLQAVSPDLIAKTITDAGYPAKVKEVA